MTTPASPILITGCSTGIGRATALRLVGAGHTVWATARKATSLVELEAAGCVVRPLDVTDEPSMAAVVDEIESTHGAVGTLINNAGYGEYGPVEEVSADALRRQFETNVVGPISLTQLVLPAMRERRRGRIINVSSMGGRMTLPGGGAYHASKYALESLSDALRFELRGFGLSVVLIEPGPVTSDFVDEATTSTGAKDSPYRAFRDEVARINAEAYAEGKGALAPDAIAAVIQKASESSRPRARYLIGSTARNLVTARRLLSDAGWDRLLRSQLPTPS